MTEASVNQCNTLSEYLKKNDNKDDCQPIQQQQYKDKYKNSTIPALLKEIRTSDIENPTKSADAVKKLIEGIAFIEREYDAITSIIVDYEKAYLEFKETGAKYCTAERQWNAIKEWKGDEKLWTECEKQVKLIKCTIKTLRCETYQYNAETDQNELPNTHPSQRFFEAVENFRLVKTCLNQRIEEEESITGQYTKDKDFKKTVEGWFSDLKTLHDSANDYYTKKKPRPLYAIYLEAEQVWEKITGLTTNNPQWLKERLTDDLKRLLFAKHERFLWHDDWLKKQTEVDAKKSANEEFTKSRRRNFIREAEDVMPKEPLKDETAQTD